MPLLFLLGLGTVFLYLWISRRRSSLTRLCRWRLDRAVGPGHFRCAACGATCDLPAGLQPRQCLRPVPDRPA
jgi:hypothetical protein